MRTYFTYTIDVFMCSIQATLILNIFQIFFYTGEWQPCDLNVFILSPIKLQIHEIMKHFMCFVRPRN